MEPAPITMPTSACTAPTSADPFGRRNRDSVSSKSSAPSVGSVSSSSSSKRKSRSSVHLQQEQDVVIPMGGDHTKRDKFLERNRIAASKCRQRKKEWINGLEEAKNGLETQNSHLQMEYNGLLSEVSRMKNQIMAHANCHDPNIDKWIENEARRFVQGPTATEYQPPVPFPAPSYPNPSGPSFAMSYEGYADEGE
ncbi:unnamed protein product [Parascedosporium putredinis]|uniref:BZIP domain-containing protein n=1 Tax=Parascedosporium putredinis TaxID=1442378 RepID=A0A9P1H2H5_9PEZI|nr:unnamed protein product [Parascedosporium putredinis]CAI7994979.1 unnamed protein product [Parascedosporium putredinis]